MRNKLIYAGLIKLCFFLPSCTKETPVVLEYAAKTTCTYSWYINGDKSQKMRDVIYGENEYLFPDSVVNVLTLDEDGNRVLMFKDVLHNCYNWNESLYALGYETGTQFYLQLFNKLRQPVYIIGYSNNPKLQ